jgi:hypothetical protein
VIYELKLKNPASLQNQPAELCEQAAFRRWKKEIFSFISCWWGRVEKIDIRELFTEITE